MKGDRGVRLGRKVLLKGERDAMHPIVRRHIRKWLLSDVQPRENDVRIAPQKQTS